MKLLVDIIPEDVARHLYEAGYMVIRRPADPFEPPPGTVPKDRVYQWMHMESDKFHWADHEGKPTRGWAMVEHERHPGVFGPIGFTGHIIKGKLGLFEKPKFEVEREQQSYIDKARAQSDDFFNGRGFTGGAKIIEESGGGGQVNKVVERASGGEIASLSVADRAEDGRLLGQTRIPQDMRPHLQRLMAVRDEYFKDLTIGQVLDDEQALLFKDRAMNAAIEKIRSEIRKTKETTDAPSKAD